MSAPASMKAIVQTKYGSPDDLELQDVEQPGVGDNDVLVRVRAASVHPDVWHVVCGRPYVLRLMGSGLLRPKNRIPGTDMAGVVSAVDGTDKIEMLRVLGADAVIDYTQQDFTRADARYDLIFDVPGNHRLSDCLRALKPDGRYVLIGHEAFGRRGSRLFGLFPEFFFLIFRSFFAKQLRLAGQGCRANRRRSPSFEICFRPGRSRRLSTAPTHSAQCARRFGA